MNYVDSNLTRGERVIYRAKLHKSIFALPAVLGGLGVIFLVGGLVDDSSGGEVLGIILLLAAVVFLCRPLTLYLTTEMAVTNRRVIGKQGLIRRKTLETNIRGIGGVQVNQSILDRVMGRGNITITAAGAPPNPFVGIAKPLNFRRAALEIVDHR